MTYFGERARKILDDVAERWEKDPKREEKMVWSGIDNSHDEESCENDAETIILDSDSDFETTFRRYSQNLDDLVVEDDDDSTDATTMQKLESVNLHKRERHQPVLYPAPNRPAPTPNEHAAPHYLANSSSSSHAPHYAAPKRPLIMQSHKENKISGVIVPELNDNDQLVAKDDSLQCALCFTRMCNVALIPCGHAMFCLICISDYLKRKEQEAGSCICPTCSLPFTRVFRIFR